MNKITDKWIKEKRPCGEAMAWWDKKERDPLVILDKLITEKHYDWANWLVVRVMVKKQYVAYAIFAAEQVIDIYERKYPNDQQPRNAIEAAKKYLQTPSLKNKNAAYAAANAAYAAANAANAANAAAAANAANAAANAAYAAAYAANAAYAAYAAAAAANAANAAAREKMQITILKYGIKLLKEAQNV
jgi:hypothetical protein